MWDEAQKIKHPVVQRKALKTHKPQQQYLSYLLRLWQTGSGEGEIWRTSLQRPGSEERQGFADLEELMDFLKAQTRQDDGEMC